MLIGQAEGVTRFRLGRDWDIVRTNPEYLVESETPCTVCKFIRGEFTPYADALVQQSLLDFNMDCITRWRACDTPAQIMPSAWRIYKQQSERKQGNSIPSPFKCEVPLEILGRDNRFALVTEVTSTCSFLEPEVTRYVASLRSIESLKNEARQRPENLKNLRLGWTDTVLAEGRRPAEIKRGDRIIFLFEAPLDEERDVVDSGIGPCSYVLDTVRNRAAIERGISHDGLSDSAMKDVYPLDSGPVTGHGEVEAKILPNPFKSTVESRSFSVSGFRTGKRGLIQLWLASIASQPA